MARILSQRPTVLPVIGQVLSCSLVAYGFARFRFPLRNFLFIVVISTLLIPPQVTLVPQFILFSHLGWIDTFKPLIVPAGLGNVSQPRSWLLALGLVLRDWASQAVKARSCRAQI